MLKIKNLSAYYGSVRALSGVTMRVREGEVVTLIGANGAGKTTLLNAICGLVKKDGELAFDGRSLIGLAPEEIVGLGVSQVPEGRQLFAPMTVAENLELGAYRRYRKESKAAIGADLERVFQLFPRLQDRLAQQAGTMSGGEQQMLAIGRALMSRPKFLMLDEPSLGIAPKLTKTIFEKIVEINRERGITVLLVEQNANLALEVSHRGYVLETGRILLQDESAALRQNPEVRAAYLGG